MDSSKRAVMPTVLSCHNVLRLTHWGRVTHTCVGNLIIIGSDNVLAPGRRQAIIWTNAGILLIWPLGTNFCEVLFEVPTFSVRKMRLKWRPFFPGRDELTMNSMVYGFFSTTGSVVLPEEEWAPVVTCKGGQLFKSRATLERWITVHMTWCLICSLLET